MNDQVTTIEQSKRLVKLGVPAKWASMAWEIKKIRLFEDDGPMWGWTEPELIIGYYNTDNWIWCSLTPAFTVADLLEIIPHEIMVECNRRTFELVKCKDHYTAEYRGWPSVVKEYGQGDTAIETLYNAVVNFLADGYKLDV